MPAVRVSFVKPTTYANGVPIGAGEYTQTFVTATPVPSGAPITVGANFSGGSSVDGDLPPGDYIINARADCNIPGVGSVFSDNSADVAFTVPAPIVGDKPNPPTDVVPVLL